MKHKAISQGRSDSAKLGYIARLPTRSHDSVGRAATTFRHSPLYVLFRTLYGTAPADTQRQTDKDEQTVSKAIVMGMWDHALAVHAILRVDEQFSLSGSIRLRVLIYAGRTEPTHTKHIHAHKAT